MKIDHIESWQQFLSVSDQTDGAVHPVLYYPVLYANRRSVAIAVMAVGLNLVGKDINAT